MFYLFYAASKVIALSSCLHDIVLFLKVSGGRKRGGSREQWERIGKTG